MKKIMNRFLVLACIIWTLSPAAYATTRTWSNGSSDGRWSNPLNWGAAVPQPGDDVLFNNTSVSNCVVDMASNNFVSITVDATYTGTVTFQPNCVAGTNSLALSGDLTVNGGKLVFQSIISTPLGAGFTINAANVTVGSGGTLSADGQGFASNMGLGAGSSNSFYGAGGGSHGGRGGWSAYGRKGGTNLYGSVTAPVAVGSGGGDDLGNAPPNGGSGGGAIALFSVSGVITVNGTVSANGSGGLASKNGGGGSGGSVWLTCNQLAGSGTICADGGAGGSYNSGYNHPGGGGGGGRVKLGYTSSTFNGIVSVAGGTGGVSDGSHPSGQAGFPGTFSFPDGGNVTVKRSFALVAGTYNIPTLVVQSNAILSCQGNIATTGGVTFVSSSVTINQGGALVADAQGFPAMTGPGAGVSVTYEGGGGGTYGGLGGCSVGSGHGGSSGGTNVYGSVSAPTMLGSGGGIDTDVAFTGYPITYGGGAVKLQVPSGTITINGTLSANGGDGNPQNQCGGGSGGSVWIDCQILAGTGLISANGGNGGSWANNWANGGGGGGGRIRCSYLGSVFPGVVSVAGGCDGAAGTTLGTAGYPGTFSFPDGSDVTVKGSFALAPGSYNIPNLVVQSNAVLSCQSNLSTTNGVTIAATTITVNQGGWISADAQGFGGGAGPGAGGNSMYYGGGGASHAGLGGHAQDYRGGFGGTNAYGVSNAPVSLGSGGGIDFDFSNPVSYGGGAIHLQALSGAITVDGTVSANGGDGNQRHSAGGGSGGSVWMECRKLLGTGSITATGGAGGSSGGWSIGGGGGGGRICLDYIRWNYEGTTNVLGGIGPTNGMPGSLSFRQMSDPGMILIVE